MKAANDVHRILINPDAPLFTSLFHEHQDGLILLDANHQITASNNAFTNMTGFKTEDLKTYPDIFDYFHLQDEAGTFRRALDRAKNQYPSSHQFSFKRKNLSEEKLHISLLPVPEQAYTVLQLQNTEASAETFQKMKEFDAHFQALFHENIDAVYAMDLDGYYYAINQACADLTGYTIEDVKGFSYQDLVLNEDLPHTREHFLRTAQGESQSYETRIYHKDGRLLNIKVLNMPVREAKDGHVLGVYGIAKDVTDEKLEKQRRHLLAFYDPETHLPNRRLFLDHAYEAWEQAVKKGDFLSFLCINIDGFEHTSATLSQLQRQQLLYQIGQRLAAVIPEEGELAKWDGNQYFALITSFSYEQEAGRQATDMLHTFEEAFLLPDDTWVSVSATIGISTFDGQSETTVEELIEHALDAMVASKKQEINCYGFYHTHTDESRSRRLQLGHDMYRSLKNHDFYVLFQPIMNPDTEKITAVEALLRWKHPELGIVSPGEFIPIAEGLGAILPLGEWVLQQACSFGADWINAECEPVRISVNVSIKQLLEGQVFVNKVRSILKYTNFPPELLQLEITETALLAKEGSIQVVLQNLSALGVQIAIDDFGTGYSSLSHLKSFPVHTLKIDRSFIHDIDVDDCSRAIAASLTGLARQLKIDVVAEGIETKMQADILTNLGCEGLQGFYFSYPSSAEQLKKQLSEGK
ncbi:PAS domain S-box-containing protein/diguanylate cyclase (GGDEF)-like protein [Salsuginibacillus halophilus]|uniref:PAS domain S-box-containing protein/diguanylate cyclase (GGDEF)-like protein n=1 Tax=Salsuginibacillus halophilus TaxID=517424 RepID=A0A2P8H945_9BACI|nr:bifunctional diguanylate cyclase/phosphodiesterase [Salsuginibacillus halophilus]PSL42724.1 PAS domain S-box-containing protein/diguanylate cyclase (GGDEF)-like protein [Salsuginibacillus halophilus]